MITYLSLYNSLTPWTNHRSSRYHVLRKLYVGAAETLSVDQLAFHIHVLTSRRKLRDK